MTIDRRGLPRVSKGTIGVEIGHTISSDWRFFFDGILKALYAYLLPVM